MRRFSDPCSPTARRSGSPVNAGGSRGPPCCHHHPASGRRGARRRVRGARRGRSPRPRLARFPRRRCSDPSTELAHRFEDRSLVVREHQSDASHAISYLLPDAAGPAARRFTAGLPWPVAVAASDPPEGGRRRSRPGRPRKEGGQVRILARQPHLERGSLARETPEVRPPAGHLGPLADRGEAEVAGCRDDRVLGYEPDAVVDDLHRACRRLEAAA